jgi:hypothetical protein
MARPRNGGPKSGALQKSLYAPNWREWARGGRESDAQDGKSVVLFLLASGAALQLRRFMGANRDVDFTIGRYG